MLLLSTRKTVLSFCLLLALSGEKVFAQGLPTGWSDGDIGSVGVTGSATYSSDVFTVKGGGSQVYGSTDAFHFVCQSLSGDGSITARLVSVQGGSSFATAGVMIRETIGVGSTNAKTADWPSYSGIYFDYRATTNGSTSEPSGFSAGAPYWLRVTRTGNSFSSYVSSEGLNWRQLGSAVTITMAQSVEIGLSVNSGSTSSLATATFDNVSVNSTASPAPAITSVSATTGNVGSQVTITGTSFGSSQGSSAVFLGGSAITVSSWSGTSISLSIPSGASSGALRVSVAPSMNDTNPISFAVTSNPLPQGWLDQDVGLVGTAGSATFANGVFTVNGAGQGIFNNADAFHFAYTPLSGDGSVIARIASVQGGSGFAAMGTMIRETLDPASTNAKTADWPSYSGIYFDLRSSSGGSTSEPASASVTIPYWVKIARSGNLFSSYVSSDGSHWTQLGSAQTINMVSNVEMGLGVTSGSTSSLATATFDNVSVSSGGPGGGPSISGINPPAGNYGTAVTLSGSNFGSSPGTVTFNSTTATTTSWSPTSIRTTVPNGATTGNVVVTAGGVASNGVSFGVYNPSISSVTPPTVSVGGIVTLNGSGFVVGCQVNFTGASPVSPTCGTSSIQVTVPSGATSGPVTVSENGVTSNSVQLNVENLSVTGISPASGPVGSTVVISGTGFGASQSSSTVDFSGTTAAIQSWSDTQIVAIVPQGANSGTVDVTVGSVLCYGPPFNMTKTVQLTDSKSNQSTYTSVLVGGLWASLVGQGSGCSTCTQRGNISYTYDANGNTLSRTDENGNTTTYTYDSNGNVLTVTVPISSGHTDTTTYTYNSFGEVLTVTDPMGFVTTNTYDSKGNLLSLATPAPGNGGSASVTQFTYNSLGELTKIIDPRGNATSLAYTSAGLIQTITDAQSNVTTYGYDSKGNRTSVTDANNKQTTFTYDTMNRLTKITYPDTTTTQFGYDYRGRRTSVTDQNGKTTTYAHDDADRLITVTDAANHVTTYGYDTESNLTSIQDANLNTTYFAYDAFGRVTQTTFPSGYIETYGYDNVGNLSSKTDRKNQLITYTYDQLNRLTKKSYPDTSTVNYTYDDDSRLTQAVDPTGTYQFTFDNMGRLTGTSTQYAFLTSRTFTTAYSYDAASNRTGFTDPEVGSSTYVYDTLNRLQTLTPPAAISGGNFGFGYDPLSRRTSLTRPNSVDTSYTYDNLSRLLSVTHALSGTTLDSVTYTLDNAGNRLTRTPQPGGTTSTYGYDNIYELLSVTQGSTTTESYTYDPVGNRLTDLGSSTWSYNTSNELSSRPSYSYTYDANGNSISKTDSSGTTQYGWDFENRLTSVTLPGSGGTVSFKYDPFGRRIYKSSSSGTSIYAYDQDNLVEETNASGGVVARYTQTDSIDEPVAMLRSGATSYYQADGLGTLTSLSNASGALAQTYTFDSFGKQTASSGSLTNPFQFTGREFDGETSLYFYRARYFDPAVGRFLNEDPMRFFESPNFYAYVENNPLNLIDTSGLQAERPGNLPLGTPQQYWGPFSDGFNEALNRLNNARCAEQFEPSCHEGPYNTGPNQMRNTTYRFLNLGSPNTGAATADATNVFINTTGLYMTAKGGGIRLPNGFSCNLGNVTNVRAFILLHELGHQLKGNTGFTQDVDDAATNSAHSMRIIKACFQCQ